MAPLCNQNNNITSQIYYLDILTTLEKNLVTAFDPEQTLSFWFEQKILKVLDLTGGDSTVSTVLTFSISNTFLRMAKNESQVFNIS